MSLWPILKRHLGSIDNILNMVRDPGSLQQVFDVSRNWMDSFEVYWGTLTGGGTSIKLLQVMDFRKENNIVSNYINIDSVSSSWNKRNLLRCVSAD